MSAKIIPLTPDKPEAAKTPVIHTCDPLERIRQFFDLIVPRLVDDIPAADYHKLPAVNASLLKKATPKEMLHSLTDPDPPTPAMMLGTLTHSAILEPEIFDSPAWHDQYQIFTKTKTLDSKAALEALAADPRPLITPDMLDTARRSRDAVWQHKEAARLLLEPGRCEMTAQAWDAEMGCARKCRVDRLPDNPACGVLDVKTTSSSLLLHPFRSECFKYSYGLQMAFYLDTLAMVEKEARTAAYLIAVTKEAPFMCRVFEMQSALPEVSFICRGRDIYQERFAAFVLAWHEQNFSAYEDEGACCLAT